MSRAPTADTRRIKFTGSPSSDPFSTRASPSASAQSHGPMAAPSRPDVCGIGRLRAECRILRAFLNEEIREMKKRAQEKSQKKKKGAKKSKK